MINPHIFAIQLKDSPFNPTKNEAVENKEAYYFATKYPLDENGNQLADAPEVLAIADSDLPVELKAKLDDVFADVLAHIATL